MATQIDTLREQFEQMNLAQKKAFIERLRLQLQGKSNPFLNECIQKYNTAARGGSPVTVPTAAAVPVAAQSKPKSSPLLGIIVCLIVVAVIGGGVLTYLALSNSNSGGISIGGTNDNEKMIGEWKKLDSSGNLHKISGVDIKYKDEYSSAVEALRQDTLRVLAGKKRLVESREQNGDTFTFRRDGSYIRIVPQIGRDGFIEFDYVFDTGTYKLNGDILTLYPDTENEKTYDIEFADNKFILNGSIYDTYRK